MRRYIDADSLINYLYDYQDCEIDIPKEIAEFPTADIVEVVRCCECKHYDTHNHKCWYWNHGIKVDDYCSKAERRTDETD